MSRLASLCVSLGLAAAGLGCGDDATAEDAGAGLDGGPATTDAGARPDASVTELIPDHACTNLSGVFRVTVDGEIYGPFVVRLDPRDASEVDWNVISCDTTVPFTMFLHFALPAGATRPLSGVELPQEVAALDPAAEGYFNGSVMSDPTPEAWARPVLGFRPAFGGGAESTLRIETFDATTLAGHLDSEASGDARVQIDFDLTIE